jgi:histidinol-phosphate aminotransferase
MSRAAVAAMAAYTLELREAKFKLNQNESPADLPRTLKEELFRRVMDRPWNRYPDFEAAALREAIARAAGMAAENVLAGNGSNELLAAAVATFVGPGTPVVVPRPSFTLYEKLVAIAGGTVVPVAIDPRSPLLPIEAMRAAASADGVIIVCSPNNPTGGVLPPGGISVLLETGATVLLDRAYGEFAEGEERGPLDDRLITFSTFSKAWGLAALRIGWLSSSGATCREIRKVKLPYNLNVISEAAAMLALEHPSIRDGNVARVRRERTRVAAALRAMRGIEVFPSAANFVTFRVTASRPLFDALCLKGVLIRDVSGYPGLANCLRVSIGSPAENDAFLEAMKEIA